MRIIILSIVQYDKYLNEVWMTRKPVYKLKQKDIDLLLEYSTFNDRDSLIFNLLTKTGMKASELSSLKKSDINYKNKTLTIKNKKYVRELPIDDQLLNVLDKAQRISPDDHIINIGTRSIERRIQYYSKVMEIDITIESIREYKMRQLLDNGIKINDVKQCMGLKSIHFHDSRLSDRYRSDDITDTYLYFIQYEQNGWIKIGVTKNFEERLKMIQNMSPVPLKTMCVTKCKAGDERTIHKLFQRFRLHGEWFEPSEELLAYIKNIKDKC